MRLFGRVDIAIMMVCRANICRSPMAAGILRARITRGGVPGNIRVASAGTHASQPGRVPDARAQRACTLDGIDIRRHRAQQIRPRDFETFDYILAMDTPNLHWLLDSCQELQHQKKISLIGSWADDAVVPEIPDPYYGNQEGFLQVFLLLDRAIEGFANKVLVHQGTRI